MLATIVQPYRQTLHHIIAPTTIQATIRHTTVIINTAHKPTGIVMVTINGNNTVQITVVTVNGADIIKHLQYTKYLK